MHIPIRLALIPLLLVHFFSVALGQLHAIRSQIDSLAQSVDGTLGVAIIDLDTGDTLSLHGDERFPMQSVFKFPLALATFDRIDKGMLHRSQIIRIYERELVSETWSPIRESHPATHLDLPLDSILYYTVSLSDNIGCDVLFRILGRTDTVNQYVRGLGLQDIAIVATEAEMHRDWSVQYRNWSSPRAMAHLLRMFHTGTLLSDESTSRLWDIMASSPTGLRRLRAMLPNGSTIAHKTGSSGADDEGFAAATNDVGIIRFPNGRCAVVAVFLKDSRASEEARDRVIALVGKVVGSALAPQH